MPLLEKPRIFISYARTDGKAFAGRLRRRLIDEHGFAIWQDLAEIQGGKDWWQQIEAAIRHPDLEYLILVVTENSLLSEVVRDEWRLALQEGKCVLPVIGAEAVKAQIATLPGWMKAKHLVDTDDPEQWQRFIRTLESPCEQPRAPMMAPRPPTHFIPRPAEFEALQRLLISESPGQRVSITAALKGAGGYGKTTLAKALCHDDAVQQRFHQGILWVTLGETPDLIKQVLDLIEVLTGTRPGYADLGAAGARLGELLGNHAYLLVIDDVWQGSHLEPFLRGGAKCGWLITTRNSDTLPQESERVQVDAMKTTEAVSLLRTGLPAGEAHRFEALAVRLGEWPLLLRLVNGVLAQHIAAKQPLPAALDYVDKALDKRGLTAFKAQNEADRNGAVEKSLGVSLDLLTPEQRERFAELAIFPEDTAVPLAIVERLWKATGGLDELEVEDLCDLLFRLSLLLDLDLDARTLRLHDVIRALLGRGNRAKTPVWHGQLLDGAGVARWAELSPDERYLWRALLYHLKGAGREAELHRLLFEFDWLQAKLAAAGINALLADFDFVPGDAAGALLRHGLRTAAHILGREPGQLAAQLLGRLTGDMWEISALLAQAREAQSGVWLRPLRPTLIGDPALLRTLEGHATGISAVAITPNGRRAVSGAADSELKVWDLGSGALLDTLVGHAAGITAVAITPNGKYAVSASQDRTLKVWDLESGTLLRTLEGHLGSVRAVAITPDGKRAVSASQDRTLKVWELDTNALPLTLDGHAGWVRAVAITPDGNRAVSGAEDNTLKIWDLHGGGVLHTMEGHASPISALAIASDGKRAVSGAEDNTLKVWCLDTAALLHTAEGHANWVSAVTITPDGRHVVSASRDKTLGVWELDSGTLLRTLQGHADSVRAVAITPDGKRAVSGSRDRTLKLWDLDSAAPPPMRDSHAHSVGAVTITPDGKRAVSGSEDKMLKVWDLDSGALLHTLEGHTSKVNALAITPDGQRAVSASDDYTLKVWDLDGGTLLRTLEGHGDSVTAVAITPDGKRAVSGSTATILKVWELDNGTLLLSLKGHDAGVTAVAITPDGKRAVSASQDNTLKVWDLERGDLERTLEGHKDFIGAMVITPDGKHAVSASEDRTLKVWSLDSSAPLRTLEGHVDSIYIVAITPDGKHAVSGSRDRTLKVWELDSAVAPRTLKGHAGSIYVLAITPDGKRAVSGSYDHTVVAWDLTAATPLARWSADAGIDSCAITPDGRRIVAGDRSGRLHFLELVGEIP